MRRTSRIVAVVLALFVALGVFVAAQPPAGGGPDRLVAGSGRALREWDDRIVSMERERQLRMRAVQEDSLIPGRRHERLNQYFKGVRVFGGEVVRETDGQVTYSVTASVYPGIRIDTNPALSEDAAARVFQRETGAEAGTRLARELVVFPRPDNTFVLAYRLSAFLGSERPVLFVNAQSGAVEFRYNDLKFQQATALIGNGVLATQGLVSSDQKKVACALQGTTYLAWDMLRPTTIKTYDLKGNLARAKDIFNGRTPLLQSDMATNTASTWADPVVVDAHTYAGWTYDYFYTRHGWKGLNNGNSRAVHILVHSANRADFTKYSSSDQGTYYTNAFYCGSCGSGGRIC